MTFASLSPSELHYTAFLVVFLIFSESSFHFFVISVRKMAFMSVHTSPSYCLIRAE